MKKLSLAIAAAVTLSLAGSTARAATSSGTLTVTATVQSAINMIFNTDASGVALTGAGTNAATLAFGTVSAYGTAPTHVTVTPGGTSFTISTPVDVNVIRYNSSSANCALTAQLGSADAVNTWTVGGVTVTSSSAATISSSLAYQSGTTGGVSEAVSIAIPYTTASATNISNTINFTATAN
jgi:hypothetical protein